ncbi:Gfo/Idh/MocA family protein [Aeromicrobium sp.]|uniref:Gfo/Idh/MocA family protein n=1 Tax=Aeromicrobium sp. TaxID=1871063 RepID=UPI003D6B514E
MPLVSPPVRWGILATGNIAHSFAEDLALVPDNALVAVGSRSAESARAFAGKYSSPSSTVRAHPSYSELADDPDVDVVYVATPHGRHEEDVLRCFESGKAVLCEKALTLETESTERLVDEARRRGLFFAEAMWMRTNPNIRRVVQLAHDGACGTIGQVRAELGFVAPTDVARLWDPALGASALLDIGIYPLTLAHLVLGAPDDVAAAGTLSERGIDLGGGATLTYPGGAVASLAWTQMAWSDNRAAVSGDGGRLEIPARFHEATGFTYARGETLESHAEPVVGRGYAHEVEEVAACLRAGRTESGLLPLDGTVAVMRVMDEIRGQLGVRYG